MERERNEGKMGVGVGYICSWLRARGRERERASERESEERGERESERERERVRERERERVRERERERREEKERERERERERETERESIEGKMGAGVEYIGSWPRARASSVLSGPADDLATERESEKIGET
jgi:hypothetical protein